MNEIICPHCQKPFRIDEAGYADILNQVRNHEFEEELKKREVAFSKEKESAVALVKEQIQGLFKDEIAAKEKEIISLRGEKDTELISLRSQKDNELSALNARLHAFETEKALAVNQAVSVVEKERDKLANYLETEKKSHQTELAKLEIQFKEKLAEEIKSKEEELQLKDELIERYKDMKAKLSTKMIGETLEQHCEIEFNKIRSTAFPQVYFQKDNDTSSGTKGDYVFRENDSEGNEVISIMFEMKNEADDTNKKQKIDSFFKKLDEDRKKKNCEYAVMVTLLEADNDLYNTGIVDVSYLFPKMYVIRPQFFIPMITLLRNAAQNSMKYKAELNRVKNQHIDITNFEDKLSSFKQGFDYNRSQAVKKFETAVTEIDKSIKHLNEVKENLLGTINQMRLASDKLDELTIKKLTHGNSTMKAKFEEARGQSNEIENV
jgi:hypothetical protein